MLACHQGAGGAALRDGVYLLPNRPELLQPLQAIADDAAAQDGKVWLLPVLAMPEEADYRALFDRSAEYAAWTDELAAARAAMASLGEAELLRLARRLGGATTRSGASTSSRRTRIHCRSEVARLQCRDRCGVVAANRVVPRGHHRAARPRVPGAPLGHPQASLGRPGGVRWLIQRFIDPHATFLWLDDVRQCPADALGFDFDGATFTHFEDRVSFEVLLASFGLEEDKGL